MLLAGMDFSDPKHFSCFTASTDNVTFEYIPISQWKSIVVYERNGQMKKLIVKLICLGH